MRRVKFCMVTTVVAGLLAVNVSAQEPSAAATCKAVHADLVEAPATVGCKPEHTSCFLGEVDGNHGLRGTTYFKGDPGSVAFPPGAPNFRAYAGSFEYITPTGTLFMREAGMVEPFTPSNPLSGIVNAYQRVVSGTGEFEGATGYLFVSGANRNQRVVTRVYGEICKPAHGQ